MSKTKYLVIILFLTLGFPVVKSEQLEDRESKMELLIEEELKPYTCVYVSGNFDVELIPSPTEKLHIYSRNMDPKSIEFKVKSKVLQLRDKTDKKKNQAGERKKVTIYYNKLRSITLEGTATAKNDAVITGSSFVITTRERSIIKGMIIATDRLDISSNGFSSVALQAKGLRVMDISLGGKSGMVIEGENVGQMKAGIHGLSHFDLEGSFDQVDLTVNGKSDVDTEGTVGTLSLVATDKAELDFRDSEIKAAAISIQDKVSVKANITETIEMDLSGESTLQNIGEAKIIRQDITGRAIFKN